jgi:hypothetical protein
MKLDTYAGIDYNTRSIKRKGSIMSKFNSPSKEALQKTRQEIFTLKENANYLKSKISDEIFEAIKAAAINGNLAISSDVAHMLGRGSFQGHAVEVALLKYIKDCLKYSELQKSFDRFYESAEFAEIRETIAKGEFDRFELDVLARGCRPTKRSRPRNKSSGWGM